MNFNQHVKRICIPEDRDNSVLKITSTEIESTDVDDDGTQLVEYKALWRKPITVSFDPNGAEGSVPDVHTRYQLDWQLPSIDTEADPLLYHPSNYEFVGWSLDPSAPSDGTGTGDQFVFSSKSDGPLDKDDFTMHAIWNAQPAYSDDAITVYEKDGPATNLTYTIPYTGTYEFYVASGGGGGAAWYRTHNHSHSEGQGGYGYWGTFTCDLVKGDVVNITSIGGGGDGDVHKGGNGGTNGYAQGGDGGATELYVSNRFHVTMSGGQGGKAHSGTYDGSDGQLSRHDNVAVTHDRMLRWVLPSSFGIPYADELSAWAISGLQNNNTKLPTANTSTYKNGKTYAQFWTTYLNTMPNFLNDYKGSANLEYGTPDIFQMVKKYRPTWTHYNSPPTDYKNSPKIIGLASSSVNDLVDKSKIWVLSNGKYTCKFAGKTTEDIAKMVIQNYGITSTDGNRGTAAKQYASSGVHGCVKIVVKTIQTCNVTWNGNGGTNQGTTEVENTFAIRTADISTLPTSTRIGYTQNKWWTAASGGEEVTLNTIVNNSFTAYAHWTPNTYTITWDSQGGTAVSPWSMSYGTTLGSHGALPDVTKTGYTLNGWWTTSTGEGTQITTSTPVPAANTTYYARWNDIGFTTIELTANTPLTTATFPPGEYGIIMTGSGNKSPQGTCSNGSAFYARFNIPSTVEMTYGIDTGSPSFSNKLEPGETVYGSGKDYVLCMRSSSSAMSSAKSTNDTSDGQLFGDSWSNIEIGPIDGPDIIIPGYVMTNDQIDTSDASKIKSYLPSIYTHVALIKNGSSGSTDRPSNLKFAGDAYLQAINLNYGASPTSTNAGGPYLKIYKIV